MADNTRLRPGNAGGDLIRTVDEGGVKTQAVALMGTMDNGTLAYVPITAEGHLEVALHGPRLPFGEIEVNSMRPVFQTDAVYGVNATETLVGTDGTSGSATAASNMFVCSSGGTAAGYYGTIQSRKRLRYRPGQGIVARFTMLFETGVANNVQALGVGTAESTLAFGYNGAAFGILYSTGGVREIQTLTVTVGSGGAESVTVKLNNVDTVVAVVAGNATSVAYQLAMATYVGWTATQRGATVVFLSNNTGNKASTFSLASTGTTAGTFAETLAGVATTDNWIAQTDWNGDKLDGTGASGVTLIPERGNVAQIAIQYLGFGAITFQIEATPAGNNPDFVTVHTLRLPNTLTGVSISQPSFPFLMTSYNTGTASASKAVRCASFAGFVAGNKYLNGPRMTYLNLSGITSSTSAYTPIFTIRNERVYKGRANQAVVQLLSVSGATKSTNGLTTFFLVRNATLSAGIPNFVEHSASSCTYTDSAATACTFATNEQIIWSTTTAESDSFTFSFEDDITIQPGETVTLAVRSVAATANCVGQINTREDQ